MHIIGLTGAIACGKSAIADELRNFGAKTLDIDKVTKELLQYGGSLYSSYVQRYGNIVVNEDGQLNKKLIADIIFNNESERLWVNSVAHPMLLNRARDFLTQCAADGEFLAVLEVPLLFEAGWDNLVDEVWAVYISRKLQISRLMARDKITRQEAVTKINAQMSAKEIAERADVVIDNSQPKIKIIKQILDLMRRRFVYLP